MESLAELRRQRAFLCRLIPDRALESLAEAASTPLKPGTRQARSAT